MVKQLNLALDNETFDKLKEIKGTLTWKEFVNKIIKEGGKNDINYGSKE